MNKHAMVAYSMFFGPSVLLFFLGALGLDSLLWLIPWAGVTVFCALVADPYARHYGVVQWLVNPKWLQRLKDRNKS